MQTPPWHEVPAPHAGPLPQEQTPFAQLSASVVLQAWQRAPAVAHWVSDGTLHTSPMQQPFGQLAAAVLDGGHDDHGHTAHGH